PDFVERTLEAVMRQHAAPEPLLRPQPSAAPRASSGAGAWAARWGGRQVFTWVASAAAVALCAFLIFSQTTAGDVVGGAPPITAVVWGSAIAAAPPAPAGTMQFPLPRTDPLAAFLAVTGTESR